MTIIDSRQAGCPTMTQSNGTCSRRGDYSLDWNRIIKGEKIGTGGFSTVYKAKYRHKEIAIKVISKKNRSTAKIIEDLKREATVLASLKNVHIIRFLGVSFTEPFCMAVEICRGGSLQKLIKRLNIPLKTIISWVIQIAKGFSIMHNKEPPIIHRDIKADNILVKQIPCECVQSKVGKNKIGETICELCENTPLDNLMLKISDFGLAIFENESINRMEGSLPWMAPEYIKKLTANLQTDIWSFGVLIWELITKEIPYMGQDEQTLLFAIAQGWDHLIIPEDCPDILKEIMGKCFDIEPEKRPTIDEIIDLLQNKSGSISTDYIYVCNTEDLYNKTNEKMQYVKDYVNVNQIDIEETIKTGKECYISLTDFDSQKAIDDIKVEALPNLPSPIKSPQKSPNILRRIEKFFVNLPKAKKEEKGSLLTIPKILTPCKSENDLHHLFAPIHTQRAHSTNELESECSPEAICVENFSYVSAENQTYAQTKKAEISKSVSNLDQLHQKSCPRKAQENSSRTLCIENLSYISAENQISRSCFDLTKENESTKGPEKPKKPTTLTIPNQSYISVEDKTYAQLTPDEKRNLQTTQRPRAHSSVGLSNKEEFHQATRNLKPTYDKEMKQTKQTLDVSPSIEEPVSMRLRARTELSVGTPNTADLDINFKFFQSMPASNTPPPLPPRSPKLEAKFQGF